MGWQMLCNAPDTRVGGKNVLDQLPPQSVDFTRDGTFHALPHVWAQNPAREAESRQHTRSQQGNILSSFTFSHFLSRLHNKAALEITMSFGYSIGDCIALCQLASQLCERFADAPSQFKAISNE
jgi:hypothetical protein